MRALFAFAGGSGHAEPLVPFAAALRAAGHTVAFAGRSDVAAALRMRGFDAFSEPVDTTATTSEPAPLLAVDMAREERALRDGYAGRIARARATSVAEVCRAWQPDLLVCDEVDFGTMIAAERLGLPQATVLVIASGAFVRADVLAEPLDALRAEHGLPPDSKLAMPYRQLVLSPFPSSVRDPAFPLPPTAHVVRPASLAPTAAERAAAPSWLSRLEPRPVVYLTLGTIFNMESGDLLERAIAGLRELPIELVVTIGPQRNLCALGPQPSHVHVEQHVPHALLLPHCDLVVSHGGSGTLVDALAAGLPSLILPLGADQPLNAVRCEALGIGAALDALAATPAAIRAAATRLLEDPAPRAAARRIQAEIAALPGPELAVGLLEALARSSLARTCR